MKEILFQDKVNKLLTETKAGEDYAFNEIVEKYRPLIESCICYFIGKADPEELEQEALIALYRAACSYDPSVSSVSFGLYAKICINNSLISLVRTSKKHDDAVLAQLSANEDMHGESDPSSDYINKESFIKLDEFVCEHLSAYEYSVFRLYIEGYKTKEIAQILSKTEKSVEGAIMRMRIKLRSSLKKYDL